MVNTKIRWLYSLQTLCDAMDYSPPASPVHWILQARILEWVAIPFSRESSWPRDWTSVMFTLLKIWGPFRIMRPLLFQCSISGTTKLRLWHICSQHILSSLLRPTTWRKRFLSKYYHSLTARVITQEIWQRCVMCDVIHVIFLPANIIPILLPMD